MISRPGFNLAVMMAVLLAMAPLAGCSMSKIADSVPDQRLIYKKQREASDNLEIPPDLAAGTFSDALDIPGAAGEATTFSEYAGGRERRQRIAASGDVLPSLPNVQLKRRGDDRWIEVKASPQAVWPKAVAFWREQGLLLVEQNPAVGVMRTDWLDNRAEIRKDVVTRMVSKVVEGVYSTSTRDQYTLRLEEGESRGSTDIRLTHRGMVEKAVADRLTDNSRILWEPSGSDREKEAEMLRRLMVYLGASQGQATAGIAASGGGSASVSRGRLASEDGMPVIVLKEEYRNAWRLTGLALDRAGFAVEDRDQSTGIYYVRYAGTEGPGGAGGPPPRGEKKPGLMSRMAFWRKDELDKVKKYQVKVWASATESRVAVLDEKGAPERSAAGQRILGLVQEQMR